MSKQISKNVKSADQVAGWDLTLDNCVFYREDVSNFYTVSIGSARYAAFTKKSDADDYIAQLNSATYPIRNIMSAQYASQQLVILGSI